MLFVCMTYAGLWTVVNSRSRDTRKTEKRKTTSSLLPLKMIAKLEWTQSNVQHTESHNVRKHQQRINSIRTTALEWTSIFCEL